MSDSMAPARAAHLVNLGLPATYEADEVEDINDGGENNLEPPILPTTPLAKPPPLPLTAASPPAESPRTPKSASGKKVSFMSSDEAPSTKRTQMDSPPTPGRKEEGKLVLRFVLQHSTQNVSPP